MACTPTQPQPTYPTFTCGLAQPSAWEDRKQVRNKGDTDSASLIQRAMYEHVAHERDCGWEPTAQQAHSTPFASIVASMLPLPHALPAMPQPTSLLPAVPGPRPSALCTGHRETPNARPPCCHAIIVPPCHCAATPQATIWVDVESLKEWEEIKRRRPKGKEVMLEEWRNARHPRFILSLSVSALTDMILVQYIRKRKLGKEHALFHANLRAGKARRQYRSAVQMHGAPKYMCKTLGEIPHAKAG